MTIIFLTVLIIFVASFALPAFGAMSDSKFLQLCIYGTAQEIADAIEAGANVNAKEKYGYNALMAAAGCNDPEVIKLLLNAGAGVNDIDEDDRTALMWAAKENPNPEVIKLLIEAGANVNAKDKGGFFSKGKTALDYAREKNNTEAIKVLEYVQTNIKELAEQGEAYAQYKLGMMYATGDGVPADQWEAVIWLKKAAQQGHRAARNELARRGIYE